MGTGLRNLICSVTFTICFILQTNAADQQKQYLPSAMVVGSVYCDTCFQQQFSTSSHFIAGASVVVKCDGFQREVKTNQHGVFKIRLPLGRNVDAMKTCSVKLGSSSQPFCSVASSATSAGLQLKSIRNDVYVFSAGFFTFRPLKKPYVCNQKTELSASAKYSLAGDDKRRMVSTVSLVQPIPFLPSPPNNGDISLPPNPSQPPSSILPPLPFQPSAPPFIDVPSLLNNPPFPKIPPFLPFPKIPPFSFLPPLPCIFPPLPPFPPLFPGNPPASPPQKNTP